MTPMNTPNSTKHPITIKRMIESRMWPAFSLVSDNGPIRRVKLTLSCFPRPVIDRDAHGRGWGFGKLRPNLVHDPAPADGDLSERRVEVDPFIGDVVEVWQSPTDQRNRFLWFVSSLLATVGRIGGPRLNPHLCRDRVYPVLADVCPVWDTADRTRNSRYGRSAFPIHQLGEGKSGRQHLRPAIPVLS